MFFRPYPSYIISFYYNYEHDYDFQSEHVLHVLLFSFSCVIFFFIFFNFFFSFFLLYCFLWLKEFFIDHMQYSHHVVESIAGFFSLFNSPCLKPNTETLWLWVLCRIVNFFFFCNFLKTFFIWWICFNSLYLNCLWFLYI